MSATLITKTNKKIVSYDEIVPSDISAIPDRLRNFVLKLLLLDPFIRFKHHYLLKAFIIWRKCVPLIQLCTELKHQLQERSSVFEALRESYFKDVICLKYHLEQIAPLGMYIHVCIERK